MYCFNCGCLLAEYDYCTNCGTDVGMYKKIMYASNHFYNEGLQKAQVRDLSGAAVSLRQSIKFNKNNIEARNLLGLVYFELGEVGLALSEWVISQNQRSDKNMAGDYIAQIQAPGSGLGDMSQSIHKYNLAYYYCTQGSKDLAKIQLKGALNKNAQLVKAHILLGLLYMDEENWEHAEREMRRALKIDHNNTLALTYLKETDRMLEPEEGEGKPVGKSKNKNAIRIQRDNDFIIQPANVREPRNSAIGTFVNILIGLVIGAAAVYFLVVPARLASVTEESQASIKEIGDQIDSKNSTIKELQDKVASLEKENTSLSNLVDSYSGDTGVISDYDQLMEIASDYLTYHDSVQTAELMDQLRDNVDVEAQSIGFVTLYQSIITSLGPDFARNCYLDGIAAYESGDYATAIEKLSDAWYYDNTNADAIFSLANAYRMQGNYEAAVAAYEQVISLFPGTERASKSEQYINEING
ncbi:MAG: tetratricopeptide repeat protein [Lachnospiraceae bacterium]|nr:tetratricopeptide repeat protein [Lachnospiraceae bacterium]